jgi:CRISPR-associated endonuclease Csn1
MDLVRERKLTAYDLEAISQVAPVFVSRMPRRKVTGAAHKETIKSLRRDGTVVRKVALPELKIKEGEIEDYYEPESDRLLYDALKNTPFSVWRQCRKGVFRAFLQTEKRRYASPPR